MYDNAYRSSGEVEVLFILFNIHTSNCITFVINDLPKLVISLSSFYFDWNKLKLEYTIFDNFTWFLLLQHAGLC